MSFKRNDIVNKQRLRDALEEDTSMGFAHNDIVTTYAMDKAIAEGGGGGGDLTTATVTIKCEVDNTAFVSIAYCDTFDSGGVVYEYTDTQLDVGSGETKTVSAILYKGECDARFSLEGDYELQTSPNMATSGNKVYITGDCTITIAAV